MSIGPKEQARRDQREASVTPTRRRADKRTATIMPAISDDVRAVLDALITACEEEFIGAYGKSFGDADAVAVGPTGPSAISFGMIRAARKAIGGTPWDDRRTKARKPRKVA